MPTKDERGQRALIVARVTGLEEGRWKSVELRALECRVGWAGRGPSLEGDVLDNFKIVFEGEEDDRILIDDFEIRR